MTHTQITLSIIIIWFTFLFVVIGGQMIEDKLIIYKRSPLYIFMYIVTVILLAIYLLLLLNF